MGDWIHCNECVARFRSNLKFFLTECGHLYCGKCAEKVMHLRTCSVCNKKTSVLQLSKEVELNILEYFMPVEAMIKKTCEVIQFQNLHRNLLFNALLKKYNAVKKECINANNTIKRVMKENHELKSLLSLLTDELDKLDKKDLIKILVQQRLPKNLAVSKPVKQHLKKSFSAAKQSARLVTLQNKNLSLENKYSKLCEQNVKLKKSIRKRSLLIEYLREENIEPVDESQEAQQAVVFNKGRGGSSGGRGPYVTSTPASQKSSTLFHNNSMLSSIAPAPSFGSAEPRDRNPQIFPGYARRVSMKSAFDVSSTHGPSPAHVVPIHRGGHHARTAYSLEELRRGKSK